MACTRCHGLMLKEHLLDMEAGCREMMWSLTWRCVNCGHRDDAVMQQHRRDQTERVVVRPDVVAVPESLEEVAEPEWLEPLAV